MAGRTIRFRGPRPQFGAPRSSEVHEAAARAAGLTCRVLDIPGLALDVDTIDDVRDAGLLACAADERNRQAVITGSRGAPIPPVPPISAGGEGIVVAPQPA